MITHRCSRRRSSSSCAVRVRPTPPILASIEAGGDSLDIDFPSTWVDWVPSAYRSGGAVDKLRAYQHAASKPLESEPLAWAAFAFTSHMDTPVAVTRGPTEITVPPLSGALSFGAVDPAGAHFGQLLINMEFDRIKAALYAREAPPSEKRDAMEHVAAARRDSLARFERVFCRVLGRAFRLDFPFGQHSPDVFLDGEEIPLDQLGEGMRSTVAWLADLLVRLERVSWADTARSPLEQDFWLILDEIDESLHPNMQAQIFPALRELFPNARIYATTHSPFVIASAAEGVVFPIRPDHDHKVRGLVEARPLRPGESLELVTEDVFQARYGFVDQPTRDDLDAHDRDVRNLERKREIDWSAFMARRDRLMQLNDEVRTVVAMQEVRVQKEVLARLRERVAAPEREARP